MARWRVGVDSGGTFTDVCLFDEDKGRVEVWKVPSTPDDPSRGIARGVEEGMRRVLPEAAADKPAAAVVYFGHGTTVATNALIQHRGVRTGLVTTDGFRDLLEIGRQKRPDLYDIQADKPPTLVPRNLRIEVPERVRHTGEVDTPLDEASMRAAARTLAAAGVEATLWKLTCPSDSRSRVKSVKVPPTSMPTMLPGEVMGRANSCPPSLDGRGTGGG